MDSDMARVQLREEEIQARVPKLDSAQRSPSVRTAVPPRKSRSQPIAERRS